MSNWIEIFPPGTSREDVFIVEEDHLATHVGSGNVRVLATPWMIAYIETTARLLLAERLPAGFSSVGVHLDVSHLAPTLPGAQVAMRAAVKSVEGVKVVFEARVMDNAEAAGEGTHTRVIIDEARFAKRLEAKAAARQMGEGI